VSRITGPQIRELAKEVTKSPKNREKCDFFPQVPRCLICHGAHATDVIVSKQDFFPHNCHIYHGAAANAQAQWI
jgi:hypothetical protein